MPMGFAETGSACGARAIMRECGFRRRAADKLATLDRTRCFHAE